MIKKIIQNKFIFYLTGIFFILIYCLSRTFMGVYILNFRIGEIAILGSLLFLICSIFIKSNTVIESRIWTKGLKITTMLLVLYFIISVLYFGNSISNSYIYKTSSYVWSLGFIFFGVTIFENRNISQKYLNTLLILLGWIYFYNIYGISDSVQSYLLIFSDKFEYHKGSDLLIMFVVTFFIFNRFYSDKRIALELFTIFSALYLPFLLYKSRGAFIAFVLFFILEMYLLRREFSNFNRNLILLTISGIVLIQSIFTVTKSGYIAIEEIDTRAEQIITYRAPTDTDAEYIFLYIENGRFFSTDGNLNWRIQIWQDVISDLTSEGKILIGYGYGSKIPAMEPLYRSGVDGTNENVHNFLVNILARGGLTHLLMYLTFFTLLIINISKLKKNKEVLNLFLPVLLTSLFDASMENSHFPLIFYITIGLYIQNLDSIKDSY